LADGRTPKLLDPNRPRLYDFPTEVGPSSRCRGEAALRGILDDLVFPTTGQRKRQLPGTLFSVCLDLRALLLIHRKVRNL